MTQLVDQRLNRLRRSDVGPHRDLFAGEVAVAVLASPPIADHLEPRCNGLGDERSQMSSGAVRVQELGSHRVEVRELLALGLRDVENMDNTEASDLLQALLFAGVGLYLRLVPAGSEDRDALLLCG